MEINNELTLKLDSIVLKKYSGDVLLIGEIGQNHNGDIKIAKKLIDLCKNFGVKLVKFQKRDIKGEFTKEAFEKVYDNVNSFGKTYGEHRNFLELNEEQHLELKQYANERDLIYFCTPCDIESVKMLERIKCPFYKIASRDITNIPLLEYIGKLNKTVIISTGMAEMEDIDLALKALNLPTNKVIIMQCTSEYPCPSENANLNVIKTFNEKYKNIIGFSDHTDGVFTALCSVFCGAKIIEKHITLSRSMRGSDHAGSLEPQGLQKLSKYIKNVPIVLGSYKKELKNNILYSKNKLMKSLTSKISIKKGEIITQEMLCLKCPGNGILYKNKDKIIGKKANIDIDKDKTLKLDWFN
jgi:sialic acid synthase SpsE